MENMEKMERCEICGHASTWGGGDPTMWGCEGHCGITFCEKCFADSEGASTAHEMFSMDGSIDAVLCPTCYKSSLHQRGNA